MSTGDSKKLDAMPVHSDGSEAEDWKSLSISGEVDCPLNLSAEDVKKLPQQGLTEDFICEEGWIVPDQSWEGIPLREVLEMSRPLPNSNYVSVHAGEYSVGLTLYEVYNSNIMLAVKLNSEPLSPQHGGPCRLVASGKQCYYSVKWVNHIEVMALQPHETAREIALARVAARNS